jgi:transcriptional regulator with XRE-family HTH domain
MNQQYTIGVRKVVHNMTIGERIKARRNELMLSQRDLCEKMGYSNHSTIGKIEAGKVDIPQSRIVQFAEVLGVSVAYLMGWEEIQQKNDIISDVVIRMQTDEEFAAAVESLYKLDKKKLSSILTLLD